MPKTKKVELSFSTMKDLYEMPHTWINKIMGIEKDYRPETLRAFDKGKSIHRVVQDHVSGRLFNASLENITEQFPIVEVEDFDPQCKFRIEIDEEFDVIGFVDGKNCDTRKVLEVKTSSGGYWSPAKFKKSPQRKISALAELWAEYSYLITAHSDMTKWTVMPPKTIQVPITKEDRDDAMEYIMGAIKIIKSGNFTSDLEDGVCTHYNCPYGRNCYFRQ